MLFYQQQTDASEYYSSDQIHIMIILVKFFRQQMKKTMDVFLFIVSKFLTNQEITKNNV